MSEETKKSFWTRHHHLPRLVFPKLVTVKRLRTLLFLVVSLVTLVALFYAEEDARGKFAWNRYMEKARTRAVELDWRAYVPPPVADNQNFAASPLFADLFNYEWTKTNVHWHDTNIWQRLQRVAFSPAPRIPGVRGTVPLSAPIEDMDDWMRGRPIDLKAWQEYFRRWSLYARTSGQPETNYWMAPVEPGEPARDVLFALARIEGELGELREAAAKPASRFPIHYDEIPQALLAHLAFLLNLSRDLQLRAAAELSLGDSRTAFADAILSFRCADALETEPFAVSQRVRARIMETGLQSVWEGLRDHRWAASQIEEFQRYLAKQDLLNGFVEAQKAGVAFGCGWIDLFSVSPNIASFSGDNTPVLFSPLQAALEGGLWPRGWLYQNQVSAARFYGETTLSDVDLAARRVYPNSSATNAALFDALKPGPYTLAFLRLGHLESPQRAAQVQTEVDLARVACALERFRIEQGKFPAALSALAPEFLQSAPHDVINGEPLKYRVTTNGSFILYSVGWNQKDDGGAFPREDGATGKNTTFYHIEKGDWVWRYSETD
jgi:hypothetical protein